MYRRYRDRYRERRRRRNYGSEDRLRHGPTSLFRNPRAQIAVLIIVTLVIVILLVNAGR